MQGLQINRQTDSPDLHINQTIYYW